VSLNNSPKSGVGHVLPQDAELRKPSLVDGVLRLGSKLSMVIVFLHCLVEIVNPTSLPRLRKLAESPTSSGSSQSMASESLSRI
jgi:hypothetical protein